MSLTYLSSPLPRLQLERLPVHTKEGCADLDDVAACCRSLSARIRDVAQPDLLVARSLLPILFSVSCGHKRTRLRLVGLQVPEGFSRVADPQVDTNDWCFVAERTCSKEAAMAYSSLVCTEFFVENANTLDAVAAALDEAARTFRAMHADGVRVARPIQGGIVHLVVDDPAVARKHGLQCDASPFPGVLRARPEAG